MLSDSQKTKKVLKELAVEHETISVTRGVPLRINCKYGNVTDIEFFNQRIYDDGALLSSLNILADVSAQNDMLKSKQQIHASMVEINHVLAESSRIAAKEMKQLL